MQNDLFSFIIALLPVNIKAYAPAQAPVQKTASRTAPRGLRRDGFFSYSSATLHTVASP